MLTLVAGTGYTGQRVLAWLEDGVGLGRSTVDTTKPFYQVDFDEFTRLPLELPAEYAVLYTCPPDGPTDERLRRFLAALPHSPSRFAYISTTGVYGDRDGEVVTEEAAVSPETRMAKPRVDAENLLLKTAPTMDCELVILRVPGIYGPGRLGVERLSTGGAYLREEDANPGNRIHVDDLVECCIAALDEKTPAGIYNVGDGDHRSSTTFAADVARLAGLPEPRTISWADAQEEFSPVRLSFLSTSRRVDTTKMREVLGVTPRTPEEGIAQSL